MTWPGSGTCDIYAPYLYLVLFQHIPQRKFGDMKPFNDGVTTTVGVKKFCFKKIFSPNPRWSLMAAFAGKACLQDTLEPQVPCSGWLRSRSAHQRAGPPSLQLASGVCGGGTGAVPTVLITWAFSGCDYERNQRG